MVYGSHCANHFSDNNFNQSVMFIGPPYTTDKYTKSVLQGLVGRMVFTEIDHNYVNPLSNIYIKDINNLFANVTEWNSMKYKDYSTPLSTFNEYATFAFYSLYVMDHYSENDSDIIISKMEKTMERRGFIKFAEFNKKLMTLYSTHPHLTAKELYSILLQQ